MRIDSVRVGTAGAALVRGANLRLLLDREAEVLAGPRWYFAPAGDAGGPFFDVARLSIGHLLGLWRRPGWIQACPECGGRAHLTTIVLMLSASSFWLGGCLDCGKRVEGRDGELGGERRRAEFFFSLAGQAGEVASRCSPAAKVIPGERPRFSWSLGLVGRWTPDLVVEPAVDAAPLAVLLEILRSRNGSVAIRDARNEPRFVYDWVTDTLRDAGGRPLYRRDGGEIRDGDGQLAFCWDSLYLCGPRRDYLYETRPADDGLAFDRFRGLNVMQTDGTSIGRSDAGPPLRADHPIPPVFAFLAWRSFTNGGEP
jgi:hypothetical protein